MKNKRTDIYVGISNRENKKGEFVKRLLIYCKEKKIDFSIIDQVGGYVFDNGNYMVEKSLRITLIGDYSDDYIKEFVDVVKKDYNQESILVNVREIGVELN